MAALLPVTAVLVVVGLMMLSRWMAHRELEEARNELLQRLAGARASLPADAAHFLPSVQSWVARMAGPYEADAVSDELQKPGALQARLSRPGLFVRGNQSKLERSDQLIEAASGSAKDAVLLCMSDPPESRAEKAMLQKIQGANFAAVLPSVRRLYDAEAGLGPLQPAWEAKLRAASELKAVRNLNSEWLRAPLEDGKQAARAELLVVVVDEAPEVEPNADPADGRRPEERPHAIRMGIVDLRAQAVLLRLRRSVDPGSYTTKMRAAHARAITGCIIAMEVRDVLQAGGQR
jgi:hypothetical protein